LRSPQARGLAPHCPPILANEARELLPEFRGQRHRPPRIARRVPDAERGAHAGLVAGPRFDGEPERAVPDLLDPEPEAERLANPARREEVAFDVRHRDAAPRLRVETGEIHAKAPR